MEVPELPKELLDNTFWCSIIGLRREVHKHPEPGFKEVRTQRRVREVLTKFAGVPDAQIRACAGTGLVADIKGTAAPQPGAKVTCVALRSDLDALTMTEGNKSLPYRSVNEGVAHLCGHDGHIAALCATAIALQRRADRIPSNMTVRLLFQPAEEGPGGALPMIKEGCLDGVDEVYGWHNWPAWPMGRLVVAPGTVMAHVMDMQITIRGRGGHGSQPHVCADPIVCGAAVVSALQTVVSRCLPSWSNAVVSVCTFHSGERFNVIPDTAELGGTIRDVDEQVAKTIRRRLPELVNGVCAAYGCKADVKLESLYPAVVNHAENVKIVERCSATLKDPLSLTISQEGIPLMGAEDFSFYLRERPGCFFFLGTQELLHRSLAAYEGGEDQPRSNCICHGTTYDFNDNVLPRALMMFVRIVEDRFGLSLYTQEELLKPAFQLVAEEPAAKRAKTA